MKKNNLKVTILGGAGFIGHNLALHLKKKGYKYNMQCVFSGHLRLKKLKNLWWSF